MRPTPTTRMSLPRLAALGAAVLALSACATNPSISSAGACTLVQRPGYAAAVALQSASIKSINVLHEFPASRFIDVALVVPESSLESGLSALYLEFSGRAAAPATRCIASSAARRACTVSAPGLAEAGFALVAVAGPGEDEAALVDRVLKYWRTVAPCPQRAA